jgi:hypothetical protein
MSCISEEHGREKLAREKSKRRVSADFYPDVGGERIWRVAADVSKLAAPGARWEEHRRLLPLIVNSNPQPAFRPGARGVTTLNWFDAAFRIDRIGCP